MFHSNTELLIDYWRGLAGGRPPARTSVDPAGFARLAPQAFIVGRNDLGAYGFRLAGGFVGELHGRPLKGLPLGKLWSEPSHLYLRRGLDAARREGAPLVAIAEGLADGDLTLGLEILFAPLRGPTGNVDRFVGLYQPKAAVGRLIGRPVRELLLKSVRGAGGAPAPAPMLRLAAIDGRRIA